MLPERSEQKRMALERERADKKRWFKELAISSDITRVTVEKWNSERARRVGLSSLVDEGKEELLAVSRNQHGDVLDAEVMDGVDIDWERYTQGTDKGYVDQINQKAADRLKPKKEVQE